MRLRSCRYRYRYLCCGARGKSAPPPVPQGSGRGYTMYHHVRVLVGPSRCASAVTTTCAPAIRLWKTATERVFRNLFFRKCKGCFAGSQAAALLMRCTGSLHSLSMRWHRRLPPAATRSGNIAVRVAATDWASVHASPERDVGKPGQVDK